MSKDDPRPWRPRKVQRKEVEDIVRARPGTWPSGRLEPGGYRPPAGTIAKVLQDDRE